MARSLEDILKNSKNVVFFGGAGVSTESGIPDFRSESGLYAAVTEYGLSPESIISHSFFVARPGIFFDFYKKRMVFPDARPNPAHVALARLEKAGLVTGVITQNIDGLHQMAGSRNVMELHGSVHRNYCVDCGRNYSLQYLLDEANSREGIPRCSACGGIVRPDVVLYEEGLSGDVLEAARQALEAADTLIVGGTSLAVYPAAGLLQWFRGSTLVLINRSETPMDRRADLVLRDPIGQVLGPIPDELYPS
jgi:NAD-dependent deacetylase